MISTHAPRTGSDGRAVFVWAAALDYFNPRSPHGERPTPRLMCREVHGYFNPRSPHGERPPKKKASPTRNTFQPTLPARGATDTDKRRLDGHDISTHAPRTGSDHGLLCSRYNTVISTHAPRTGSDGDWYDAWDSGAISTHAPRTGSDPDDRQR